MIKDLTLTLAKIVEQAPVTDELSNIDIVYDRPVDQFSPQKTTVNLFLYDIRENIELRMNEPIVKLSGNQATAYPPPLRVSCSYLITVWPKSNEDLALLEHRIISQLLQKFRRYKTIPENVLDGTLREQELPVPVVVLQADAARNPADFWSALGIKVRPSFTITATISMPAVDGITSPLVDKVIASFDTGDNLTSDTCIQIRGKVMDSSGRNIQNAMVYILESMHRTESDINGDYTFSRLTPGKYNISAAARGFEPAARLVEIPGKPEDNYGFGLKPIL